MRERNLHATDRTAAGQRRQELRAARLDVALLEAWRGQGEGFRARAAGLFDPERPGAVDGAALHRRLEAQLGTGFASAELVRLEPAALEREAESIRDVQRRFVEVLARSLESPGSLGHLALPGEEGVNLLPFSQSIQESVDGILVGLILCYRHQCRIGSPHLLPHVLLDGRHGSQHAR